MLWYFDQKEANSTPETFSKCSFFGPIGRAMELLKKRQDEQSLVIRPKSNSFRRYSVGFDHFDGLPQMTEGFEQVQKSQSSMYDNCKADEAKLTPRCYYSPHFTGSQLSDLIDGKLLSILKSVDPNQSTREVQSADTPTKQLNELDVITIQVSPAPKWSYGRLNQKQRRRSKYVVD